MKTFLLILAAVICAQMSQGATYTCSNHPLGGAQFASFTIAYNASTDGDTILLEKSNITYSLTNIGAWGKSLTIIGIGINPEISDNNKSMFGGMGLDKLLAAGATGSRFYGITFTERVGLEYADEVTFENCSFEQDAFLFLLSSDLSNIFIINCVFKGVNELNVTYGPTDASGSIHFLNCIFNGVIDGNGSGSPEFTVNHCLFLNNGLVGDQIANLNGATISNSFFINYFDPFSPFSNLNNCYFYNNIWGLLSPPAGNSGNSNMYGFPNFINYISGESYSDTHDYNLEPGSIGTGGATDGTDIGLHGGFTNFNEALEPSIVPIVTSTIIQDGGTEVGGTINLNVQARKPLPY